MFAFILNRRLNAVSIRAALSVAIALSVVSDRDCAGRAVLASLPVLGMGRLRAGQTPSLQVVGMGGLRAVQAKT